MARIRAIALISTLAIIGITLAVITLNRDTQSEAPVVQSCPAGYVPVNNKLPDSESEVKINVYNATTTVDLARNVAADFTNRKFKVEKTGTDKKKEPDIVARLQYGPKAVGAAQLLRAYFLNAVEEDGFDIKRENDTIDVIIGGQFKQLATPTEMRQAVAALGNPELPPGTCADQT
ncbi:LytR C-terminal domain-containing protein [Catellatospora sp. NPDC049609]|uniref:LytR C-terminal domain-containing protein n=1 Tax=Catellatospora sp. NPDC049609 TaxID=3155505 RepID=UPI00342BFC31